MKRNKQKLVLQLLPIFFLLISFFLVTNKFVDPFFTPKYYFLYLTTSFIAAVFCAKLYRKRTFSINYIDLILLAFGILTFISPILFNNIDYSKSHTYICCFLIYFYCRTVFKKIKIDKLNYLFDLVLFVIIFIGIFQSVWGWMQFFKISPNINGIIEPIGAFENPGQYAILLLFLFGFCLSNLLLGHKYKWLSFLACILILSILPITKSRSAWIGVVAVSAFLIEIRFNLIKIKFKTIKKAYRNIFIICALTLVVVSGLLIFQFKLNSSLGRVFIWKNTINIIIEKPIFGHGFGSFSKAYNDYQANYFYENPDDIENIILADNVNYAFNEFLQIGVELGLIGFVVLVLIFGISFYKRLFNKENVCNPLLFGSKAAMIATIVCSLFAYPLHLVPILIIIFIALAFISINMKSIKDQIKLKGIIPIAISILFLFTVLLFVISKINKCNAELKWKSAHNLMEKNRPTEGMKIYSKVYPILYSNQYFLYNLGAELYKINQIDESLRILNMASNYMSTADLYTYIGLCLEAQKDYQGAINSFEYANNLMPIKFFPKFKMLELFDLLNKKEKAMQIALQIQQMPVKVESKVVLEIKQVTDYYIKKGEFENK